MRLSYQHRVALLWLLSGAAMLLLLQQLVIRELKADVEGYLQEYLLSALDESYFSSSDNRVNDDSAILAMGVQINSSLEGLVQGAWYAPLRSCEVHLHSIDGIVIGDGVTQGFRLQIQLPRNQIQRDVIASLSFAPNPWPALLASGLLAFLFWGIARVLPAPLSRRQQDWVSYLTDRGYDWIEAEARVRERGREELELNPVQFALFEHLHRPESDNLAGVWRVVADPQVALLDEDQSAWFLLGMHSDGSDFDRAMELALAADSLEIDLTRMQLRIRGMEVQMGGTPLFYYAYYALARSAGDGWVTNPASNRPDDVAGAELAALMERHGGHARAINDLESAGLKAKTLDQNRSKIKEDLVGALGETLASRYLFEAERHPDGVHMRYRLGLPGGQIHVVLNP